MSDVKGFIKKYPKEFQELVDIFKNFKLKGNSEELSQDKCFEIINNSNIDSSLKDMIKNMSEDELIEFFKLLGITIKKTVKNRTKMNLKLEILKKLKANIKGLTVEQEQQLLAMLEKIPDKVLEKLNEKDKLDLEMLKEEITLTEENTQQQAQQQDVVIQQQDNNKVIEEELLKKKLKEKLKGFAGATIIDEDQNNRKLFSSLKKEKTSERSIG